MKRILVLVAAMAIVGEVSAIVGMYLIGGLGVALLTASCAFGFNAAILRRGLMVNDG